MYMYQIHRYNVDSACCTCKYSFYASNVYVISLLGRLEDWSISVTFNIIHISTGMEVLYSVTIMTYTARHRRKPTACASLDVGFRLGQCMIMIN